MIDRGEAPGCSVALAVGARLVWSEGFGAGLFRPVPLADGSGTEFALGFRVADDDSRRLLHRPGGGLAGSSASERIEDW